MSALTPITETVVVIAIVATAFVITVVCYLLVLARMGKPLRLSFSGYGVKLSVGPTTLCEADGLEAPQMEASNKE